MGRAAASREITRALESSMASSRPVELRRGRRRERLDGFVVGLGIQWVLLHRVTPELALDGHVAVRRRQVREVREHDDRSVVTRALRADVVGPTPLPGVLPTSTGSLLRSVAGAVEVLSVHPEELDDRVCWIGRISAFPPKAVELQVLDAEARWQPEPVVVPFKAITRVELGARYDGALRRLAGPPPTRLQPRPGAGTS